MAVTVLKFSRHYWGMDSRDRSHDVQHTAYAERMELLKNYMRVVIGTQDESLRKVMEEFEQSLAARQWNRAA